jgi:predicted O-methyltransferase YrrM
MSSRSTAFSDALYAYYRKVAVRESAALAGIRRETAGLPMAGMQISPEQGRFMAWLVRLIGARRAIEVGTFTGYSAAAVAEAMGPKGRLIACDVSPEWTAIGLKHWRKAKLAGRISLRLGPALATLDELLKQNKAGRFDFAFIDADKTNYQGYYDRCVRLLRPGGLVAIDNVFWGGAVANPNRRDADTKAIRAVTRAAFADRRVSACMLPIGDGLLLAHKL